VKNTQLPRANWRWYWRGYFFLLYRWLDINC